MTKNLLSEFGLKDEKLANNYISDYETFQNKELLDKLRSKIIEDLIDNNVSDNSNSEFIRNQIDKTLVGYDLSNIERSYIYNLIDNEINGYGPITDLLNDKSITEIMVNSPNEIYVEIDGRLVLDHTISFINDDHIIRTIQRMIQPLGRTIDTTNPMVDARLKDGSRLNAVIPPLAIKGPVVTIRKFKDELANVEDLLRNGTMTSEMARFLEACVREKFNVIISGGTGSGKTTLLNVLSSFVGENERIITIEDAAELKLKQNHVISLETRLTNYEGTGEVTIRDLVKNSLRMRPDRIIVGEVRGKEAFDMLQAMNTGHTGSLTTMHANSPSDALNRLESMIMMAGFEIPVKAIREYIEKAINIIVHIERLSDGRRKIVNISEVTGFNDDIIETKEIFTFKQTGILSSGGIEGEFVKHRYIPKVYKTLKIRGINDLDDIFE